MRGARVALVVAAVLAAGCSGDAPPPADPITVPPPEGGGFAPCASKAAIQMAVPYEGRALEDAQGRAPGIHAEGPGNFTWVYAAYVQTLREDRVTRINEVTVHREPAGGFVVCTRVDIATPTQVDEAPRTYDVGVALRATSGFPEGPVRVVVNWVAGCPCETLPRGNATAEFA